MIIDFFEKYHTFQPEKEYLENEFIEDSIRKVVDEISLVYKIKNKDILFILSHGNKSNISMLRPMYDVYEKLGVSYLAYDYPGYGKSVGKPSEEKLYKSLDVAINYAINELGFSLDQIVLHGVSLGGAVTIDGLSRYNVKFGIVDSTFTNNIDVAKAFFPKWPVYKFISPRFNSIEKIKKINTPMLITHAQNDETIPFKFGKKLYEAKRDKKQFYCIDSAGHRDYLSVAGEEYVNTISNFIKSAVI